ncbi:hypothetical protein ACFQLX_21645 [Streptomyces polyrhachis]|uniref:Cellulose-binding protein n=1 Tax=Streptomyces polyrhachis TaxID=1282885 RepID=A0ABW2GMN3_9ACTN
MTAVTGPSEDFGTVRRGYRPQQVDAALGRLGEERDRAWERAARLTVLARDLERERDQLARRMDETGPQTYEELGGRATFLLALAREEADGVRAAARQDAQAALAAARADGEELLAAARAAGGGVTGEAEGHWRSIVAAAEAQAAVMLAAARADAQACAGEAGRALAEVRQRTAAILAESEAEELAAAEVNQRDLREREATWALEMAARTAAAQQRLEEAQAVWAEAEKYAAAQRDRSEARGAELLAEASLAVEGVQRETDHRLRGVQDRRTELTGQLEHVRASLAAMVGGQMNVPAEEGGTVVPPPAGSSED